MKDFDVIFGYDEKLSSGKWFDVDGIKIKLSYADSPLIESKVHEKRFELAKNLGRNLNDDELEKIGVDCFTEFVLLDWEEGMMIAGKPFPCNDENKAILVKKYPRLINKCIYIAKDNKRFQAERIEETVKK